MMVMTTRHTILGLALAASAASSVACGSSRGVGPIEEEVRAASLELRVSPNRFWYHTDQPIRLAATAEDERGRVLGDAEIAWSVDPQDAASMTGDYADIPDTEGFELHREGRVVFTACVAGPGGDLCDTVAIRVDDGSPSLEIAEPRPGAELDDPDGITVRGSVTDASDARVYVLGMIAEVDELGEFDMTIPATPGVNHLDVVASDGLTPDAVVEMDVLWAPAYRAANAAGDDPLILSDGLALSLGQRLLDGGDGASSTGEQAGDLAGVIALVAGNLPIGELIPDPVVEEPTFQLSIPDADLGPAEVSLGVTGSGLDLFVRFPALALATEGELQIGETVLDLDGEINASVAAAASVEVSGGDGEPVAIDVVDPWVAVESATGEFASDGTSAVFKLAESEFRSTIEEQVQGSVGLIIEETLPELLGEALAVLDDVLDDRHIELDVDLFSAPIALSLGGELGAVTATQAVELAVGLTTRLGVASDVVHPETRGVALFVPELEPPQFQRDGELQLGVRLSLINGMLHALWTAGALELDLLELLPASLAGLIEGGWISGQMAPIVRPPRPGEEGAVVLALGQVEVDVDLVEGGSGRFGATFEAALDLDIDGSRVGIATPGEPLVRVWAIEPAPGTVFTPELVEAALRDQFAELQAALLGPLALELPRVAVGEYLEEIAPDLADLTLDVELDETLRVRGDYLMLGAGIRAELAALVAPLMARFE